MEIRSIRQEESIGMLNKYGALKAQINSHTVDAQF